MWIVVIKFLIKLKLLFKILVIGVNEFVVYEVFEIIVLELFNFWWLVLNMIVFKLLVVGVEINIFLVFVLIWVCVLFLLV